LGEAELSIAIRAKAVKRLRIVRTARGRFRITVSLSHQEGELSVVTTRKQPREWASLDRLTKHIQQKFGAVPAITICLDTGEPTR
jgi:hypothetical protein